MSDLSIASHRRDEVEEPFSDIPARAIEVGAAPLASSTVASYLRYFAPLAALLFTLSIMKGWRLPGLWSATHFTFNYSRGFIRRGLVGELLRRTHIPHIYEYRTFLVFAWVMFAVAGLMLALLIRRACKSAPSDVDLRCAVLVMAASLANSELAHLVGYLDYLGLIGVIALVLMAARAKHPHTMFAWAVPFGIVSTFIHEAMALLFAPTMLFVMACRIAAQHRNGLRPAVSFGLFAASLLATFVFFGFSVGIGHYGTKSPEEILALRAALQEQVNFPLRVDAFEALWRSAKENYEVLMPSFYRVVPTREVLKAAFLPLLPAQLFTLVYGGLVLGRIDVIRPVRWLLGGLFVGASTAPLMMYLVGWDHARWHSWALYGSFVSVCAMRILLPPRTAHAAQAVFATPALLACGAAAIACDLSGELELFDGFRLQGFPFEPNIRFFLQQLESGFHHLPER